MFGTAFINKGLGIAIRNPSGQTNMCFTPAVLQDGDWVGSDEPATNIVPPTTASGEKIYSFRANTTIGDFVLKIGDTGVDMMDNVYIFIVSHNGTEVGLQWDDTNKYYVGNDIDAAQYFLTQVGEELCFYGYVVPDLLQFFNFETIEVKGITDVI